MKAGIRIEGVPEAVAAIKDLEHQLQKRLVRQALQKSAAPLIASARARAPQRTGRLRRSIGVVPLRKDRVRTVIPVAVGPVFEVTKNGAVNLFYGRFVHNGTKERMPYAVSRNKSKADSGRFARFLKFTGKEGTTVYTRTARGMKPNPFLSDAFSMSADVTVDEFRTSLVEVVEKLVNRKARKR